MIKYKLPLMLFLTTQFSMISHL